MTIGLRDRAMDARRFAAYPERPLRLLARLTASTLAAQLERMRLFAVLRCPHCRRADGAWRPWGDDLLPGARCRRSDAERWAQVAATLEPGATAADAPEVADRDETGPRDVWLCARCGRWTFQPVYRAAPGAAIEDDSQKVGTSHGDTGATEDAMIAYVDAMRRWDR